MRVPAVEEGRGLLEGEGLGLFWGFEGEFLADGVVLIGPFGLLFHHFELSLDGGVPVILDGVVRPAGEVLGDEGPSIAVSICDGGYCAWAWMMILSYSSVHFYLLISGQRWLCHR